MSQSFKKKYNFEERANESQRIMQTYPGRIPIVCEKNERSKNTPNIDKTKYLLPPDLTVGQFMYVIRKRLTLNPTNAIFLFVNNCIPPSSIAVSELYEMYKDQDGFLYFVYSSENVFGS